MKRGTKMGPHVNCDGNVGVLFTERQPGFRVESGLKDVRGLQEDLRRKKPELRTGTVIAVAQLVERLSIFLCIRFNSDGSIISALMNILDWSSKNQWNSQRTSLLTLIQLIEGLAR